jgi:predicted phosphodiesterase
MREQRGKCVVCGNRTRHKINDKFLCVSCEENMSLDDKINEEDLRLLEVAKKSNLTPHELQIVLNQPKRTKISLKTYDHRVNGHIKIGIMGDTHIGESHFDEGLFKFASEIFRKEGIKNIYHTGDILEGMSGRPGHIYELSQIGFSEQMKYAEKLIRTYMKDFKIYAIQGNHDRWFKDKNNAGVSVGEELQSHLPNFIYLGEDEADIQFSPGIFMKLFHAGDGTAYADSYKIQRRVAALEGSKKPSILCEGHYHKALYIFNRNVHCLESGTFCGQTNYMRGKNIPAHKGFWILEFDIGKRGKVPSITNFTPRFYPAYD